MADEQHIEIRIVVVLEHEIILWRQERRDRNFLPAVAARLRAPVPLRSSLRPYAGTKPSVSHSAIGLVTSGTPMLQSALAGARTSIAHGSPARQPLPASCFAAEASASGTESPDVGAAVAVEIDRVFVEFRRQKLRKTHRAAPGRAHVGARHAVLQHLQGMQEFISEEILALADIGLRRQHADGVGRQPISAIIGFARPDREHDIAGDAEFLLDARQWFAILRGELPARARRDARSSPRADIAPASARIRVAAAASPGLPGMARSGSERSGSRPRMAASKVARETPSSRACRPHGLQPVVGMRRRHVRRHGREQQPHADENCASNHAARLVRMGALFHRQRPECGRRDAALRSGFIGRRDVQQHVFLAGLGAEHQRKRQAGLGNVVGLFEGTCR